MLLRKDRKAARAMMLRHFQAMALGRVEIRLLGQGQTNPLASSSNGLGTVTICSLGQSSPRHTTASSFIEVPRNIAVCHAAGLASGTQ